jgi:proteic killer suppression protein
VPKQPKNGGAKAAEVRRFCPTSSCCLGTRKICPNSIWKITTRKLDQIDSVTTLNELRIPPNNKLEALSGDRKGQYSIRINDQYRTCFVWTNLGPGQVEIVDYH